VKLLPAGVNVPEAVRAGLARGATRYAPHLGAQQRSMQAVLAVQESGSDEEEAVEVRKAAYT
jgi:hypothetical protein